MPLSLGARGWDAGRLGALYAAAAALEAVVHPLLGRWADRQGALAPISAGLVGSIVVLAGLAVTAAPWLVAGLVMAAAVTFGATFVPGMALLTRAADAAGLDGVLAIALANFAWALGHAVGVTALRVAGGPGRRHRHLSGLRGPLPRRAGRAPESPPRPRHASLVTRGPAAA